MALRSVRLEDETEAILRQLREGTGWPISEVLEQGLRSLKQQVRRASGRRPYDVYARLDLGPRGYSNALSTDTRRGVTMAVRKELRK